MKKTLVVIAIAAATLGTLAIADHSREGFGCNKDSQQVTERRISRMTDRLGLTAEQQSRFREILTARHAEKLARRDATLDQVLTVLNDEQRVRFQAYMDRRGKSSDSSSQDEVTKVVDRKVRQLSDTLSLSEAQQTDIAEVLTEERLNKLERRQATRERIAVLLTEDQLAKFETMRESGRRGHQRFKGHRNGGDIEHRIDRMTRYLGLDEQQQQQLGEIFEQQRSARQDRRDETFEQLATVLNDDQKADLDKLRDRRSNKQR